MQHEHAKNLKKQALISLIPQSAINAIVKAAERGESSVTFLNREYGDEGISAINKGVIELGYHTYLRNVGWIFSPTHDLIVYI